MKWEIDCIEAIQRAITQGEQGEEGHGGAQKALSPSPPRACVPEESRREIDTKRVCEGQSVVNM